MPVSQRGKHRCKVNFITKWNQNCHLFQNHKIVFLHLYSFFMYCVSNLCCHNKEYVTNFPFNSIIEKKKSCCCLHALTQIHICLSVIISCPWEPPTTANNVGATLSSILCSPLTAAELNKPSVRQRKKETSSLQSLGTSKQGNSLAVVEPENNGKSALSI